MKIVKDWTTVELMEFMNSYKKASNTDKQKFSVLMKAVLAELKERQPIIAMSYAL